MLFSVLFRRPITRYVTRNIFVALLFIATFAAPTATLAQDDSYEVQDVTIDMPTTSPATARDTALAEATKQAYATLKTRMAGEGTTLPDLDDAAIGRAVQDFELNDEKVSGSHYTGTFTIRFRPTIASTATTTATGAPATVDELGVIGPGLNNIPATFVFARLPEWQSGKAALHNVNGLRGFQIVGLRRNYVDLVIRYAGDANAMALALSGAGLTANYQDGRWYLRLNQ